MIRLLPLLLLIACAHPGHRTYTPNITNFVRAVEPTKDFAVLKDWQATLKNPPIAKQCDYGNCRDRAICRYFDMRRKGYKSSQLNLWSGDYDGNSHMILAVESNGREYVIEADGREIEAKDYFYKHFQPSYRFNENGWDIN